MTWAVFKDHRGVAYCEVVNMAIDVYVLEITAREERRNWFGKVTQRARQKDTRYHTIFDENVYDRKDYYASAFEPAPPGFCYMPTRRYMRENRWGPVDVIMFIDNDKLGQRMQYEFRKLAPEHELYDLGKRVNDLKPHPETDALIERLRSIVR